jgi:hypothetical protein
MIQVGQPAALYCRVATADQTFAWQKQHLRTVSKNAGYKLPGLSKVTSSRAKDEHARRSKALALTQARECDLTGEPTASSTASSGEFECALKLPDAVKRDRAA